MLYIHLEWLTASLTFVFTSTQENPHSYFIADGVSNTLLHQLSTLRKMFSFHYLYVTEATTHHHSRELRELQSLTPHLTPFDVLLVP